MQEELAQNFGYNEGLLALLKHRTLSRKAGRIPQA